MSNNPAIGIQVTCCMADTISKTMNDGERLVVSGVVVGRATAAPLNFNQSENFLQKNQNVGLEVLHFGGF